MRMRSSLVVRASDCQCTGCKRSWVRSQHSSAQWNLRGGRWSSVEYSTKKFFYVKFVFHVREHGRRLAENKDLLSSLPVTPTERPPSDRPHSERPPTKEPPSERPLSERPPETGSALFRTVEGFSAARVDSSGKCRSGSNNKFHLDAAFIRRVMDFERSSSNLSASSSSATGETSAPPNRTKEPSRIFQPKSLTHRLPPTVNNGQEKEEGSTDRTPIGKDALDAGKRRKQRRRTREVPVRQYPRLAGRLVLQNITQVPANFFCLKIVLMLSKVSFH